MPKPEDEKELAEASEVAQVEQSQDAKAQEDLEADGFEEAMKDEGEGTATGTTKVEDKSTKVEAPEPKKEEAAPAAKADEPAKAATAEPAKVDPKTATEKAEAAAAAIKDEPAEAGDIFDSLPAEYKKFKADQENGKLLEFLKKQPKGVQKMATEGDADDAKYVLDLYAKSLESAPAAAPAAAVKEATKDIKAFVSKYGDKTFITRDGSARKLSELVESYGDPDLFEGLAALAEAIAAERAPVQPGAADDARIKAIEARVAEQEFWGAVREAHPDAPALVKSGKLKEWAKTQSAGVQRLFANSHVPENAILVLDVYKESLAAGATEASKAAAKDRKAKLDGLHSETGRGGRDVKAPASRGGDKSADEELQDGFEEGAK